MVEKVAEETGAESVPDVAKTEREADEWRDKYMRLAAELDNSKKRLARNYANQAAQMEERLLRDLLPLADNLQRILGHVSPQEVHPGLYAGVQLSLKAFMDTLAKYGVHPIEALGEPFDPALHEAAGTTPDPTLPSGIVVHVEQTGYTVDGRLLRPARVLVSA